MQVMFCPFCGRHHEPTRDFEWRPLLCSACCTTYNVALETADELSDDDYPPVIYVVGEEVVEPSTGKAVAHGK